MLSKLYQGKPVEGLREVAWFKLTGPTVAAFSPGTTSIFQGKWEWTVFFSGAEAFKQPCSPGFRSCFHQ